MENLERNNYLFTIIRNGKTQTIVCFSTNPIIFLKVEKEIGNETHILFAKTLTDEEYKFYHNK